MKRENQEIRYRGKSYHVTGRLRLGGKTYLVLEHRLSASRTKYKVFDPHAGLHGGMRSLHVLPRTRDSYEYVRVISRMSEGNVNFPNIVGYHVQRERIYVVLDWIHGTVLRRYLKTCRGDSRSRPSAFESFRLFRGLAHGLRHMHHKKNSVHGDIRPENLVLCREPNRLMLIDFGSAWRAEATTMRPKGDGISEFYNSPEQLQQRPFVDFRSDQFSASVVFYEMLTLERPYRGLGGKAGLDEHYRRCMEKTFVPPSRKSWDSSQLPKRVWKQIDRLVHRGLQLRPDDRYPNARDWLEDIDTVQMEFLGMNRRPRWLPRILHSENGSRRTRRIGRKA